MQNSSNSAGSAVSSWASYLIRACDHKDMDVLTKTIPGNLLKYYLKQTGQDFQMFCTAINLTNK